METLGLGGVEALISTDGKRGEKMCSENIQRGQRHGRVCVCL